MTEDIRMAEARASGKGITLHLTPFEYSCKEFNLSLAEAKHLWHRLGIAINESKKKVQ